MNPLCQPNDGPRHSRKRGTQNSEAMVTTTNAAAKSLMVYAEVVLNAGLDGHYLSSYLVN